MVTLEKLQNFLVRKGIIFPTAEIYGGLAGFFDYGPLGVELKRTVRDAWWKRFARREDSVGMEGSIITNPRVWEASGHLEAFHDPLVECQQCKARHRADHLVEDKTDRSAEGMGLEELAAILDKEEIKCPRCGGRLVEPKQFHLMFATEVGPVEGNRAYLRPETAQLIFVDFPRIYKSNRGTLPFGIAQVGTAFRNEISPRNFVFRAREFEQMELEYFFNPDTKPELAGLDREVAVLTREMQANGKKEAKELTLKGLRDVTSDWHVYWLRESWDFLLDIGLSADHMRLRQHRENELSHYSQDTWDVEYHYPFGWKEVAGIANRTDYDLQQHAEAADRDLSVVDGGEKVYPWVLEPSFGTDRIVMALIADAWHLDGKRQTLRFEPQMAPVQVAVFPLVNKEGMPKLARGVYNELKGCFRAFYDDKGSIGRRYRRQDSIGTPFCVTVDGQSVEDGTVTVRHRDSMEQDRVAADELKSRLWSEIF